MTFILCPIITVLCAAGSPDCKHAKEIPVHGQMNGKVISETNKYYIANFIDAAKRIDAIGYFLEVKVPKKKCQRYNQE